MTRRWLRIVQHMDTPLPYCTVFVRTPRIHLLSQFFGCAIAYRALVCVLVPAIAQRTRVHACRSVCVRARTQLHACRCTTCTHVPIVSVKCHSLRFVEESSNDSPVSGSPSTFPHSQTRDSTQPTTIPFALGLPTRMLRRNQRVTTALAHAGYHQPASVSSSGPPPCRCSQP